MLSGSVPLNADVQGTQVVPVSISAGWKTLSRAINSTSAVTPGSPTADDISSASTGLIFNRQSGLGTNVRIRAIYHSTATQVVAAFRYRLWGRKAPLSSQASVGLDWQVLPNRNGDTTVTMTVVPLTDVTIATGYKASMADIDECTHDCDGNDEFIVEIIAALDHDGTDSLSRLQVKII